MSTRQELRETLDLAVPIATAQIALMTMGLVDSALVGRVSAVDLTAVSVGNGVFFAAICPAMGVTMAVEPLSSQAVGAGEDETAWRSLRAGLLACVLLAVPSMALALVGTLLFGVFHVAPEAVPTAIRFVFARLPGVVPWLCFMATKSFLEAKGVTRPLYVGALSANVVNVVVCGLLVFGDDALRWAGLPPLGLTGLGAIGAGIAMSVANALILAVAFLAAYRLRPPGARLFGRDPALLPMMKKLLRVGLPIGMQIFTEVFAFVVLGLFAASLGVQAGAAHQIAFSVISLTFMGILGIGGATAVRVGRAIGRGAVGAPRRAGVLGVGLGAAYSLACATLIALFAGPLASLFTADPALVRATAPLFVVAASFQIFDGVQGVSGGALRGAADTAFASWANVACHWLFGLPLAYLLAFHTGLGLFGLWVGVGIGLVAAATALFGRFLRTSSRGISRV